MSPQDVRATRAGRVTAAIALVALAAAAMLVLAAADGWRWASTGLGACGLVLVATWSIATFEMARHQRRTGLSDADREAWDRRAWPATQSPLVFFAGVLVPWIYLLGSPPQRRLATYERRTARRKVKR